MSARADWFAFIGQWLRNPLQTAAVAPSGRDLAQAMVDELPHDAHRVIELGGGTGSMTRALIAHGIQRHALLILELNESLAAHLRKRFPGAHVAQGDAADLQRIAAHCGFLSGGCADAIVSSLGLLNMPEDLQRRILEASFACLRRGGRFIQFTYGAQAPVSDAVQKALRLKVRRDGFVLRNVPPATVYVYERQ
ncbi:Methyltransferase type 12 [Lysobacter dokdonensis DS-58]|uniref:Methyltransferase type 12 n=1 Tax=Lysobacter dokdonensis DS-58 TaxID=1300345 RepID=A0A0A2WIU7_9GAMM|nr:methyltransferase domain-containing protein [Lysobacter dokdonensis]KGQ19708.1 Methyltransferase type 12 [Lysobacter dokdonensis DS-58]